MIYLYFMKTTKEDLIFNRTTNKTFHKQGLQNVSKSMEK